MPSTVRLVNAMFILCLIASTAHSQAPSVQWKKCYGGSNNDYAGAIRQLSDGSYIICGRTGSSDGDLTLNKGVDDAWLAKLGTTGTVTWQQPYGGNVYDAAENMVPTFDGGYVFIGYASSLNGDVSGLHGNSTISDIWVVKTNSTGTLIWQKCLGGTGNDIGTTIQQTADSGFILSGSINSNNGDVSNYKGNGDAWIAKLDKSGNITWKKAIGGAEGDDASSIRQTTDGGYIFTGATNSVDGDLLGIRTSTDSRDVWVVKLDAAGAISWQKCYGGSDVQEGKQILQTADGGYIVAGITTSTDGDVTNNYGGVDCWVLKLSSTGSVVWQKTYGGSSDDYAADIIAAQNGGYIFCGYTKSNDHDVTANKGFYDLWLVRLGSAGNIVWQQTYGGVAADAGKSIIKTGDGGYAVLATTSSTDGNVAGNHGSNDLWVIKLGQDPTSVPTLIAGAGLTAYPTYTDRYSCLQLPATSPQTISNVTLLNASGAIVASYHPNAHACQLDFEGYATGYYLLRISLSDYTQETIRIVYHK